jgi:hypothetical protein
VRNGVATIRTEKTDGRVTITILPPLLEPINAAVNLQKGTNVAALKVFPKVIRPP